MANTEDKNQGKDSESKQEESAKKNSVGTGDRFQAYKDILDKIRDKDTNLVNEIEEFLIIEYAKRVEDLENTRKELKKKEEQLAEKNNELEQRKNAHNDKLKEQLENLSKEMKREIRLIWPFSLLKKKNYRYTEKYYNRLVPFFSELDMHIPNFSTSWNCYRHNFDGLHGLVEAAIKIVSEEKTEKNEGQKQENKEIEKQENEKQ